MWYTKRNTYLTEEIKHIYHDITRYYFIFKLKNHDCKRQNVDVTHSNSEII